MNGIKTLPRCANGCDATPHPPSKVICRRCQDAISDALRSLVEKFERRTEEHAEEKQ